MDSQSRGPETRRSLLALGAALLLGSAPAAAQPLTLEQCLELARERNPRALGAATLETAAAARERAARARRLPSVDLRGAARYAPLDGYDPALTDGGEYAGRVEVEQPLFDGGSRRLVAEQAGLARLEAGSRRTGLLADLRLDVRLAFIDLVGARHQLEIFRESASDLESYAATVRALARGGAVPSTDVGKVELQMQTESVTLLELRADEEAALRRLAEHLGMPADTTFAVQDSVVLPALPPQFDSQVNPEVRVARLETNAAEIESRIAAAERLPSLSFVGSLGAWTSRIQLVESDERHIFGYEAGVSLDLPLWNWGALEAEAEAKRAEASGLEHESVALERHLESSFAASRGRLAAFEESERALAEARQRAQAQYDDLRARYAGGGSSSLEVLDAHRQLLDIARQQAATRTGSERLHAELLRAVDGAP